jgi:hypothetical protein
MPRLIVGLTLALALVTPPAAAQQAVAAMTISAFYMSTKAAFDVWSPQAAPPAPPGSPPSRQPCGAWPTTLPSKVLPHRPRTR